MGTLDPRKLIYLKINHMNIFYMKISQITVAPINCEPWMVKKESVVERTPTSDALESSTASLPSNDIDKEGSPEAEFSSDSE